MTHWGPKNDLIFPLTVVLQRKDWKEGWICFGCVCTFMRRRSWRCASVCCTSTAFGIGTCRRTFLQCDCWSILRKTNFTSLPRNLFWSNNWWTSSLSVSTWNSNEQGSSYENWKGMNWFVLSTYVLGAVQKICIRTPLLLCVTYVTNGVGRPTPHVAYRNYWKWKKTYKNLPITHFLLP